MTQTQHRTYSPPQHIFKRAQTTALVGAGGQTLLALAFFLIGRHTGQVAYVEAGAYALAGLPVWGCLLVLYRWHARERFLALHPDPDATKLAICRKRLGWVYRFAFPAVSLGVGAYLLGTSWFFLRPYGPVPTVLTLTPAGMQAVLAVNAALAFFGFVCGRYWVALARTPEWRHLQAGAGYMLGTALLALALLLGSLLRDFGNDRMWRLVQAAIPYWNGLIGAEIIGFCLIGFFRPRPPNAVPRPDFQSRLQDMLSHPGGWGTNIQETLDYQFGITWSHNWFLRVFWRAIWPLIGFSAAVLIALSCLVLVEPYQQGIVTRFGRLMDTTLSPGLHVKAPWPVDQVTLYDVRQIRWIHVGSHRPVGPGGDILKPNVPILWSNLHGLKDDELLIVAPPDDLLAPRGDIDRRGPSVSLIGGDIFVTYRIQNLRAFVTSSVDAETYFRQIAELEASRELYQYDVDQLVGTGRIRASQALRQRIQNAVNTARLGIEVLNVGLTGVHPPQDTASAFHETVAVEQQREAGIERAKTVAIYGKAAVAGSVPEADRLVEAIETLEHLVQTKADETSIAQQQARVEALLHEAGGVVAQLMASARAYRWQRENAERAQAEHYEKKLLPFFVAPEIYRLDRYLEVMEEGLATATKYMLLGDREALTIRFLYQDNVRRRP